MANCDCLFTPTLKVQLLTSDPVYYLPGRGGRLDRGLGEGLATRGYQVTGRETRDGFARLGLAAQRTQIAADLRAKYWKPDARLIANSYGAYLFLQAQTLLPPFPGKVLLLSPIIGPASPPGIKTRFIPPGYAAFAELLAARLLPVPTECTIHVGAKDWQCPLEEVQRFAALTGIALHVVSEAGHMLGKSYVGPLLDQWLA